MPRRPNSFVPVTDFSDLDNSKRVKTDMETIVENIASGTSCSGTSSAHVFTATNTTTSNVMPDVVEQESEVSSYLHGLINNPDAMTAGSNELQFLVKEFALKNKPIVNDDGEGQPGYVENTAKRNRIRRALVAQMKKRLDLLSEKTRVNGCFIYMFKNQVFIEGPDVLMKSFTKDDSVKQAFRRACQHCGPRDINVQDRVKMALPPRDAKLTVAQLRQILTTAVTTGADKKYIHPHWGKTEYKPVWWPDSIPYKSPCSGKNGLHKPDLQELYYSYWDYTQENYNSCWNSLIDLEPKMEEAIVEVPLEMEVMESAYYINIRAALTLVQSLTKRSQSSLLHVLDSMADNSSNAEAIALCKRLHQFLPLFPTFSSDDFEVSKSHVDIRFRKFASKCGLLGHNYEPVLCRGDGNCLFNAISISLLGVDATSDLLRAISYVHAMAYIDEIDAWIKEKKQITDSKEDVEAFIASYGLDINGDVSTIKDCLLSEAKTTLKGGVFSGFLQAVFLAGFLKVTIHQHTFIENLMEFDHPVEPVPCVTAVERDCHIMWVPEDTTDNPLIHVVPLMKTKGSLFNDRCTVIPFYCGAEKLCQHFEDENRLSDDSSTLSLVQCINCCRWFHRQCVSFFHLILENDNEEEWSCGCDLTNPWTLPEKQKFNDPREIQRLLNNTTALRFSALCQLSPVYLVGAWLSWQENQERDSSMCDTSNKIHLPRPNHQYTGFKEDRSAGAEDLIVNITSNKIVSKRKQIRERNAGETWGTQTLVTERTTIEYICRKLQSLYSCTMDSTFLQDVMLPEVLSWALTEKLKTTRLSTEVLMQNINYPDIYF